MGKHGIGLQIVKRVVRNYNGNIEVSDEDHIFDVKIMLYMILMSNCGKTVHICLFVLLKVFMGFSCAQYYPLNIIPSILSFLLLKYYFRHKIYVFRHLNMYNE